MNNFDDIIPEPVTRLEATLAARLGTPVNQGVTTPDGDILSDNINEEDLTRHLVRTKRPQNNCYYNERNAEAFKLLLQRIYGTGGSMFLDSEKLNLSPITLHIRVNTALQWLCAETLDEVERKAWQLIRKSLVFTKVNTTTQKGVVVRNKIQMMIQRAAEGISLAGKHVIGEDVVKELVEEEAQKLIDNKDAKFAEWNAKFFAWIQEAKSGDTFELDAGRKLQQSDEVWILELATKFVLADYKMDWENDKIVVLR